MKTWCRLARLGAVAVAAGAVLGAAACGGGKDGSETAVRTPSAVSQSVATSSAATGISVVGAWVRESPSAGNGAAYMVINNTGSIDDALIGAESTVANATELHESIMNGDIVTMKPVARIDIKAGGSVELKPGSYHIMLIGLKQALQVGMKVSVTLKFEKAGPVKVEAEVRE